MASGGKRGGAGERVLEGRHVIGLFMLMLLFSGVFFTLGYVMGRNQNDGQVKAASGGRGFGTPDVLPKAEQMPLRTSSKKPAATPVETSAPEGSDWEFYHAGDSSKADDHLKAAPKTVAMPAVNKNNSGAKAVNVGSAPKTQSNPPLNAGFNLQVAAMTHEADAMALANNLRKRNFPTFVQSPRGDKYFHVLVGPYADQKSAESARKGLELAGFKAIVKH